MASTISILFHCSLLVLLHVQPAQPSTIPKPKNAIVEQKPHPWISDTYIVQTNHLAKPSQFATLEPWYASMVATHSPRATTNSSSRILHTYDTVMHGFAVRLTADEARRMWSTPGVSGVYKSRVHYTQTTRSPGFMGLHEEYGAWPDSEFGDGVIIGIIDTGIWPESASFSDTGLGPVRSTWKGTCVDANDFNASSCNNKLVGAKVFAAEPDGALTPRDKVGHGTHVSGIAAGSEVRDASLFGFSRGNARGVAPRARIAVYKACNTKTCGDHGLVAAIDAAVADGVDIICMSVGSLNNSPLYDDVVAVAMFGADRRGVFVVLGGGNSGPTASTVVNVAPWMTTVGAATMDRVFPATLRLGSGVVLTGQSLYARKAKGTGMLPLVYSSCGEDDLTPDSIAGKIAVCDDKGSDVQSGMYAQSAGGAGVVAVDSTERLPEAVHGQSFTLPGITLSSTGRKNLDAYMSSVPYPVASFGFSCDTVTSEENRAPVVAGFSSRGPNSVVPEIMKPDLVAPGVNILAAWSGDAALSHTDVDPRRAEYNIVSGTSMACPHVAGVAAMIKKVHGDWTPAMVRSALITTAKKTDNNKNAIADNGRGFESATPLAAGAGLVNPPVAMDPGLVYDAGTHDYFHFLCSLNYTSKQIRQFLPEATRCRTTLAGGAANLNYPSLVAVFDGRTHVRTLTRTVTKVSEQPESYNVTFAAPNGVNVSVTPTTLVFKQQNEKKSYTVEFRSEVVKPAGAWDFGYINWASLEHDVNSTVAFMWKE